MIDSEGFGFFSEMRSSSPTTTGDVLIRNHCLVKQPSKTTSNQHLILCPPLLKLNYLSSIFPSMSLSLKSKSPNILMFLLLAVSGSNKRCDKWVFCSAVIMIDRIHNVHNWKQHSPVSNSSVIQEKLITHLTSFRVHKRCLSPASRSLQIIVNSCR